MAAAAVSGCDDRARLRAQFTEARIERHRPAASEDRRVDDELACPAGAVRADPADAAMARLRVRFASV